MADTKINAKSISPKKKVPKEIHNELYMYKKQDLKRSNSMDLDTCQVGGNEQKSLQQKNYRKEIRKLDMNNEDDRKKI